MNRTNLETETLKALNENGKFTYWNGLVGLLLENIGDGNWTMIDGGSLATFNIVKNGNRAVINTSDIIDITDIDQVVKAAETIYEAYFTDLVELSRTTKRWGLNLLLPNGFPVTIECVGNGRKKRALINDQLVNYSNFDDVRNYLETLMKEMGEYRPATFMRKRKKRESNDVAYFILTNVDLFDFVKIEHVVIGEKGSNDVIIIGDLKMRIREYQERFVFTTDGEDISVHLTEAQIDTIKKEMESISQEKSYADPVHVAEFLIKRATKRKLSVDPESGLVGNIDDEF